MSRDLVSAADMLLAARRALSFIQGASQDDFLKNLMLQSAVLHQLTILGEAARRVSEQFRNDHDQVAWAAIAGLRNRIVHEYEGIDLDKVWSSATSELPALVTALEAFVPEEPDGEEDAQ